MNHIHKNLHQDDCGHQFEASWKDFYLDTKCKEIMHKILEVQGESCPLHLQIDHIFFRIHGHLYSISEKHL